jgi:hypothetical protein
MQLDAYLQRIGYTGDLRSSASVLEALHLAHATHIPFENLDILRGLPSGSISTVSSASSWTDAAAATVTNTTCCLPRCWRRSGFQ